MSIIQAESIGRALGAWVGLVLRWRKLTITLCVGIGLLSVAYARGNLGINTDTANMISPTLSWRQDFIDYRTTFAARDRNLIVVIDAPDSARADAFARQLASRLAASPELYRSVFLVGGGEFLEENGLLYLSPPELESLADRLSEVQPLLGRLAAHLNGVSVLDTVSEALSHPEQINDGAQIDLLYQRLGATLAAAGRGERAPVAWRELLAPEQRLEGRRFLLLQPLLEFARARPAARAIERLRSEIDALGAQDPSVRARLTGTVAMEHEELVSVTRGAGVAGVAAFIMVVALLYVALRSLVLLLLAVATLLLGLACTAAFAAAAVGHLNLLSVAFAVLYVGLGVDFILHIGLRLKELLATGLDIEPAMIETIRGVGATLAVCAITTAAGFYSFVPTPFQGVSELGLVSGTGMFISLAMSVTLLPALIAQFYRGRSRARAGPWLGARLLGPVVAHPGPVLWVTALLALVSIATLPWVRFDSNPMHLRDPGTESVQTLEELAKDGAALPMYLVAIAPDHETALEWAGRLAGLEQVREVRTVDSVVPREQAEKRALLDDMELMLGPRFYDVDREATDPAALAAALSDLDTQLAALPASRGGQQALAGSLTALDEALASDSAADRERRLRALDEDLVGDLAQTLAGLHKALGARPFGREELPSDLKERWLAADGRELLEIVPSENTSDNAAAADFLAAARSIVPRVTGLPVVNHEASLTVIKAFQLAFTYALCMVLVILWLSGLSVREALLVMGPVVLAAAMTGGFAVWLGLQFNFANIIALPLLLGVGVDNGIHMVQRMKEEHGNGSGVLASSTSKAVLASGLTTIASFGNLAFSSHLGMASMGQLLTLGMLLTLALTLIVLPALLTLVKPR